MSAGTTQPLRIYQELSDWYERHNDPQLRDRFLLLAADAAHSSGQTEEAERLRQHLLQLSPHHMLKPFASFAQALRSPDVQGYLSDMREKYPPSRAAALLASLRDGTSSDASRPTANPPAPATPRPSISSESTRSARATPPPAPPLPDPAPPLRTNPPTLPPPAPPPPPVWKAAQPAPVPPPLKAPPPPATPPLNVVWGDEPEDTEITPPPVNPPRASSRKVDEPASRSTANGDPPAPKPATKPLPPTKLAAPPRPVRVADEPPPTAALPRVVVPRPTASPNPAPPPKATLPPPRPEPPRPRPSEPPEEPPDPHGVWVAAGLFAIALLAGLALAVYTLGRPFLPPGWLP